MRSCVPGSPHKNFAIPGAARPRADLDALIDLEQRVFATDRLSRASLRRLLASKIRARDRGRGGARLVGAAVVLFRAHATVARLYSIAVAPPMSGKGVAVALLAAAERAAAAPQVPLHASRSA